jgi:8-amino-7-oxononanoate synthase
MQYIMESEAGTKVIINKKLVDYFSGCGYFGFQAHPEVVHAAGDAARKYGISSATTPAFYGNNPILIDLQKKITRFFGTKDALYYASGCFGNPIIMEGLKDEYEIVFIDKESHYSSRVGTSLAGKPVVLFEHRNPEDLRQKIRHHLKPSQRPLVVCDGIFPISGEISPLLEYKSVLNGIEGAAFCVDDAHATGVLGEKGYGTFEYFGMKGEKLYSSGTFSKAMGGHGGVIAGDEGLIVKLKNNSSLVNACSTIPIPSAAATAKAIEILNENPGLRNQLWSNVAYTKKGLRSIGFEINNTPSPIICISIKMGINAKTLQEELFKKDIAVTYVPEGGYTSVPKGGAIRISIFSTHTRNQIDRLIEEIKRTV